MVVVPMPALEPPPGVGQGEEDIDVQALVPQSAVHAFDIVVLDRSSGSDEVQVYAVGAWQLRPGETASCFEQRFPAYKRSASHPSCGDQT